MKHFSLTIVAFFGVVYVLAQAPGWINPGQRNAMFPSGSFLVGFKSESCPEDESERILDKLIKVAKSDLVEQIRVTIKSTATFNLENMNSQSLEYFKQASTATSEASLTGLKTETWFDKKQQLAYAIAWLNIPDMVTSCKVNLADKSKKVEQKVQLAEELAAAGNLEQAMRTYSDCYPLLREMENDVVLIISIGKENDPSNTASLEARVNKGIVGIRKGKVLNLDEACYFIAEGLKHQVRGRDLEGFMVMGFFTYQDSRMGSEFSSRLLASLEQKLTSVNFNVKDAEAGKEAMNDEEKTVYVLNGTYWDEGDMIKIIANIRQVRSGKNIASIEEVVPKSWLTSHSIKYLPDNYEIALSRQETFLKDVKAPRDIECSLWTNKGTDNPVFRKNDTLLIFMKVNSPCYIRLIYYLADGTRLLLVENYYIDHENAVKPFRYPDPFICQAPYGQETLQVVASTGQFAPLRTQSKNGYQVVLDDYDVIMQNIHEVKPAGDKTRLYGEKRLDFTTVER